MYEAVERHKAMLHIKLHNQCMCSEVLYTIMSGENWKRTQTAPSHLKQDTHTCTTKTQLY